MSNVSPFRPPARAAGEEIPPSLRDHALDNLRYIRETMEGAGTFTAVPGWGGVGMGVTALITAVIAAGEPSPQGWLITWLVAAPIAIVIGLVALVTKARAKDFGLFSSAGRRFAAGLLPALVAGAVLTLAVAQADQFALLPGLWLLLYGAAVVSSGAHSVPIVPVMGGVLLALGALAVFLPLGIGNALLALGFGLVQMVFGFLIARRHGG